MKIPQALEPFKIAGKDFVDDDAPQSAAALSFYAVTALPPLVIILLSVVGLVYSTDEAASGLTRQISSLFGSSVGEMIKTIIENRSDSQHGVAAAVSLITLLFTASGFFGQLQTALNKAWEVKPKPNVSFLVTIKKRLLSVTAVLGTGFLLLISLVLSTLASALGGWMESRLGLGSGLALAGEFVVSLLVVTSLFTMIFKFLPDAVIGWKEALKGAASTTIMFLLGKFILSWYLGRSDFAGDYGPAGALVLLSFWIYYSSMLLLFGAELSQAYAQIDGQAIVPEPHAERYEEKIVTGDEVSDDPQRAK